MKKKGMCLKKGLEEVEILSVAQITNELFIMMK